MRSTLRRKIFGATPRTTTTRPDSRSDTPDASFPRSAPTSRHTLAVASDGPARKYGLSAPVSRRTVLGGLSLLPLVAVNGVPPAASADPADVLDAADTPYLYLSPHQAAVLDAATRRLVPGPEDSSQETTPGAHEANVVRYLDIMLSAFAFSPAKVHAGGPWSNRAGGSEDFMANFVPLDRAQNYA